MNECNKWSDNKDIFGCNDSELKPELKYLCSNLRISTGSNFPPHILVFRGGKYWRFDNNIKPNKPFGDLIDGQVPADTQWPGIHFPGGLSHQKDGLIMVYKNRWSKWRNGNNRIVINDEGNMEMDDNNGIQTDIQTDSTTESIKSGENATKVIESSDGNESKKSLNSELNSTQINNEMEAELESKKLSQHLADLNNRDVIDEEILDEDDDDAYENDSIGGDGGALIAIDEMNGRFVKVVDNKLCYLVIKTRKLLWSGDCIPIVKDKNHFPPLIMAAIKNSDNYWFYFDRNGKYCKRSANDFNECTEWRDNREVFGCLLKHSNLKLKKLCKNVRIKAGTHETQYIHSIPRIWVFRGGKYWVFDNKVSDEKPFGDLVDGERVAKELWEGIHFPGGTGFDGNNFFIVYKNKWSLWTPNGLNSTLDSSLDNENNDWLLIHHKKSLKSNETELINSENTLETNYYSSDVKPSETDVVVRDPEPHEYLIEQSIGDEEDNSPKTFLETEEESALISTDPKNSKFSKVSGDEICHFVIRNKKCYKSGNCTHVYLDHNNFPPFIVGAIQTIDKYWYFLNKFGQYCKRHVDSREECTQWINSESIYGCDSIDIRLNPKFNYLCQNARVNGGINYPPFIYLFKNNMFWKFDNNYQPNRPFGTLIEGGILATKIWPGIHFPGAISYDRNSLIVIYKTKWSLWTHSDKLKEYELSTKPSEETKDFTNKPKKDSDSNTNYKDIDSWNGVGDSYSNSTPIDVDMDFNNNSIDESEDRVEKTDRDIQMYSTIDNEMMNEIDIKQSNDSSEPEVNEVLDQPISEEVGEIADELDRNWGHAGALIPINKKEGKYAKVSDESVCYLSIRNDTIVLEDKCKSTSKDKRNKFSANIIAFIRTKNKFYYFINKSGKYCLKSEGNITKCNKWRDNKELFGCLSTDQLKVELTYLCNNPVINAGGVHNNIIYVFRGGKQWKFNNKPKNDKPFGDLIDGGYKANNVWTGIHFPGAVGDYKGSLVMIYKNKWSKWSGKSGTDIRDKPIELWEEELGNEKSGALVLINDTMSLYAKIKGSNICYLTIEVFGANWEGKCQPVNGDENKLPPNIVAVIESKDDIWYFIDRFGRYCSRQKSDKNECTKWKDNKELFGCDQSLNPELIALCQNPKISSGGTGPQHIYVMRNGRYWVFDNKPNISKPFGKLIKGYLHIDQHFKGMHLPGGLSHYGNAMVMVYENKWSQWTTDTEHSEVDSSEQLISDEKPKEPEGDINEMGALVLINRKKRKYALIRGKEVCYFIIRKDNCFWDKKCVSVSEDINQFPAYIIAAVKTREDYWYYFNKRGKYCRRKEGNKALNIGHKNKTINSLGNIANNTVGLNTTIDLNKKNISKECTNWRDNRELFGCLRTINSTQLKPLCRNPVITAGGNHWPFIYIFRGGKYWMFNNKPKPFRPFGELIEGSKPMADKWPGIRLFGGCSYHKTSFIMIYKTQWSLWRISSDKKKQLTGDIIDEQILYRKNDTIDELGEDSDSGALISVDIKLGIYVKIKGFNMCYFQVKQNTSFWIGECRPLVEDREKLPLYICAAIKSRNRFWYYFDRKGNHCKRLAGDKKECTQWKSNEDIFGCNGNANELEPDLMELCDNPIINSGGNYPPFIYVFRGPKYWKFNSRATSTAPLGKFIEGNKLAKDLWPGIHLPGGLSFYKNSLIIVYNKKWSKWKPLGNISQTHNRYVAEVTEGSISQIVVKSETKH